MRHTYLVLWIFCLAMTASKPAIGGAFQLNTSEDTSKIENNFIPLAEITNKLPEATAELRGRERTIIPDQRIEMEHRKLDTFLLEFRQFTEAMERADTGKASYSKLNSRFFLWNQQKTKLEAVQKGFLSLSEEIEKSQEHNDQMLQVWKNTLQMLHNQTGQPDNLVRMVKDFVSEIKRLEDSLNLKNELVFSGIEKLTQSQITITSHLSNLQLQLDNITETLLTEKEPSLFKIMKHPGTHRYMKDFWSAISDSIKSYSQFIKTNLPRILVQILIFIILSFLFVYIEKKRLLPGTDKSIENLAAGIVRLTGRPILVSLLISLLLSYVLYPDLPMLFRSLVLIVITFGIATTLKKFNFYIYFLTIFYLLLVFINLTGPGLISYILLLVIGLVLFAGLKRLLDHGWIESLFIRIVFQRFFKNYFWFLGFLLLVSLPAIVLGYYSFGKFLMDGVVLAICVFLLLYAGYNFIAEASQLIMLSTYMKRFSIMLKHRDQIINWWINMLVWVSVISLLYFDLRIFHIDKPVIHALASVWQAGFTIGKISLSLGKIIIFFFTIWISLRIGKITRKVLEEDIFSQFKMKTGVPRTIAVLIQYTIITLGFLIAAAASGFELKNLTIIFGALGVGIGFGLQDVINNFISGLILLFERPIRVGDMVEVSQLKGIVKQIGIRSSLIRNFDGSEVIVPNGILVSREVINWTLSDKFRRMELPVGVAYGSDLHKVMNILKECAVAHETVLDNPEPLVLFEGFGNSSLDFRLLFWITKFEQGLVVRTELAVKIDTELKKAGITIPFPQMDVYLKGNE